MHRIAVALFLSVFWNSTSFSQEADQCLATAKTSVYFSNGMFTDYADAGRSLAALERAFGAQLSDAEVQYRLSYNENEGSDSSGPFGIGELFRLLGVAEQAGEVIFQSAGDRLSAFYRFVSGSNFLPNFVEAYSNEIADAVDYSTGVFDSDVSAHVANYLVDLNEGNRIIVVSHSQGNYYVNLARQNTLNEYQTQTGSSAESSFSILSLASPASQVSGGFSHSTLEEDFIINSFVSVVTLGSTLSANVTNSNKEVLLERDWTGHGLQTHYLSGAESSTRINNMFSALLDVTEFPVPLASESVVTVTLTWDEEPDVDLHVYEPDGTHVYYENQQGNAGFLDVDDVTSFGPEHYFAGCETLLPGTYQIGVNYFGGSGATEGQVTLQAGSIIRVYDFTLSMPLGLSGNNPPVFASFSVSEDDEGNFEFRN